MEEGRVIESGSHAELLALGGRYAQSWQNQMQTAQGKQDKIFSSDDRAEECRTSRSLKDKVLMGFDLDNNG
jgi:hypothetical protein